MRFNKTTEYAFRIFAFMALDRTKIYRADEIHENLKIPLRYLKRILTQLSKTGLMESIQGNRGGFRLLTDLEEIALLDIVNAMESPKEKNLCFFGFQECQFSSKKCHMHDKWVTIIKGIDHLLETTTLADLTDIETQKYITDKMRLLT